MVLVATDAAGEGINLQRAHLMINYDLPWNPNRLEQRFGRIHRIGQTEVCHLWNLVAQETREGDVYLTLLRKLEQEREALGGAVFDVLGKAIDGAELRELMIEAIRYGDRPEVRARLNQAGGGRAGPRAAALDLLEERALAARHHGRQPGAGASARTWSAGGATAAAPFHRVFLQGCLSPPGRHAARARDRTATRSPMCRRSFVNAIGKSASVSRCCRATSASVSRRS